jgi:uncharacterized membrane protein YsdA (DUF1294 family)
MFVLPAVLALFLLFFFRSLRHGLFLLHIAVVLAVCWFRFPSFAYPFWHEYYPGFWLKVHMISLNIITFAAYGFDKRRAIKGQWRIPENTLHLMALLGGSPAAFIASKIFRHKVSKNGFRFKFWLIVTIQAIILWWALWPQTFPLTGGKLELPMVGGQKIS